MKTSTWIRDSHELFDYESPHLVKKQFKLHYSGKKRHPLSFQDVATMTRGDDHDLHVINDKDYQATTTDLKVSAGQQPGEKSISRPIVHISHHKGKERLRIQKQFLIIL